MRIKSLTGVSAAALTVIGGLWCADMVGVSPAYAQGPTPSAASDEAMKQDLVNALQTGGNAVSTLISSDPRFTIDPQGLIAQIFGLLAEIAGEHPELVSGQTGQAAYDALSSQVATDIAFALEGLPPGILNKKSCSGQGGFEGGCVEIDGIDGPIPLADAIGHLIGRNAGCPGATAFAATVAALPDLSDKASDIIPNAENCEDDATAAFGQAGDGTTNDTSVANDAEPNVEENESPVGQIDT